MPTIADVTGSRRKLEQAHRLAASARKTSAAARRLTAGSLESKVDRLKASRASDPIQQLQTEVIIGLFELIKQASEADSANEDYLQQVYVAINDLMGTNG